jgi:DNA-binding NtrC family response regulator
VVWKEQRGPMSAETILLLDDDAAFSDAVRKVLEKEGYAVVEAPCLSRAREVFEADPLRFNLVLCDLSLPGETGLAFLPDVHAARPNLPVVVITAFGDWNSYARALNSGGFEFLSKPVEREVLLKTVRAAIASRLGLTGHVGDGRGSAVG